MSIAKEPIDISKPELTDEQREAILKFEKSAVFYARISIESSLLNLLLDDPELWRHIEERDLWIRAAEMFEELAYPGRAALPSPF